MTETTNENNEKVIFEKIIPLSGKQAEMLSILKNSKEDEVGMELAELVSLFVEKVYGEDLVSKNKMFIYYEHEKLENIEDSVLVIIREKKENE